MVDLRDVDGPVYTPVYAGYPIVEHSIPLAGSPFEGVEMLLVRTPVKGEKEVPGGNS